MRCKGPTDIPTSIGLLILRLGMGGFMASHGWGKVLMLFGDHSQWADPIGVGVVPSLVLAAGAEFVCSLLVMIGFLTRFAAVPLVITMGVAAFVVHGADPLSAETAAKAFFAKESETWFSKEPALMYLIPFLALVFTGAGRFSIDWLIWGRKCAPGAKNETRPSGSAA